MCNVIHLQFTCKHAVKLRRSQCKGTRHTTTRTSIRAACTAESSLTLHLQTNCSSCVYLKWEEEWTSKLARAHTFLAKLTEKGLPGAAEISELVQDLDAEYRAASWDARGMASHVMKKSVPRVGVTDHTRASSPLIQEVRPEDIVEAECEKQWIDRDEDDYDGDYIASTDPLHPVSTDYSHPLDDDDGAWLAHHLSPEEMAAQNEDVVFDLAQQNWNWDSTEELGNTVSHDENNGVEPVQGDHNEDTWNWDSTEKVGNAVSYENNGIEPVQGDHNGTWSSPTPTDKDTAQQDEIQQVIQAFWEVVNTTTNPEPAHPLQPNPTPPSHHHSTPTPLYPQTPSSSSPSPTPLSPPPPPPRSQNSTRTNFDKQRAHLTHQRRHGADHISFHRQWLLVARREARAFEGLEGRFVPDPQVPGSGGGSGWFR